MQKNKNPLESLPQVEKLLENRNIKPWFDVISRPLTADCINMVLQNIRKDFKETDIVPPLDEIIEKITDSCREVRKQSIQKVINGSGIILHTNLGRSPLDSDIWDRVKLINTGYSNLEFNLATGKRGKRGSLLPLLLSKLTGSESALVVNNNAAAVYLMLSALAGGKEVIVSRGEQIQIGGGFRIPDILALSGAKMVEVGTTNITTIKDYTDAVTENTAMALLVHTSNFKIRGFSESPDIALLAKALPDNIILAVDQGSGIITEKIDEEISVNDYLKKGADLVCFSGDKILGGPQAGIIAGREKYISVMQKHPMMRTFRTGKTVYSLLENLVIQKLNKKDASVIAKSLSLTPDDIRVKAEKLFSLVTAEYAEMCKSTYYFGGGSAPDLEFQSWALKLKSGLTPDDLSDALRKLEIPIIVTIKNNSVYIDAAALDEDDFKYIAEAVKSVVKSAVKAAAKEARS
ncbi:MAG: L-seryl-tRNA(Sec) selenium transferase [Spirochaetia bacterium]|jgi:L-seryl-tRNA(Ser) seleniumtransferase|nr:L-seryl-tRNA(Sec) selenium transferase [Spirochaetia bacterium]